MAEPNSGCRDGRDDHDRHVDPEHQPPTLPGEVPAQQRGTEDRTDSDGDPGQGGEGGHRGSALVVPVHQLNLGQHLRDHRRGEQTLHDPCAATSMPGLPDTRADRGGAREPGEANHEDPLVSQQVAQPRAADHAYGHKARV